jgi:hypothetical protein
MLGAHGHRPADRAPDRPQPQRQVDVGVAVEGEGLPKAADGGEVGAAGGKAVALHGGDVANRALFVVTQVGGGEPKRTGDGHRRVVEGANERPKEIAAEFQ